MKAQPNWCPCATASHKQWSICSQSISCLEGTQWHIESALRPYAWWVEQLVAAEAGEGWLEACEQAGRYLAPCQELIAALADLLRRLAQASTVLEVCAGHGEMAAALARSGVAILATDADPPAGSSVVRMTARDALAQHRPRVVLGSFVPADAGVDEAVLACPSVQHYVVLNARIGGSLGSPSLWQPMGRPRGWTARPLPDIARWMITRHDVWLDAPKARLLAHGEAWLFGTAAGKSAV